MGTRGGQAAVGGARGGRRRKTRGDDDGREGQRAREKYGGGRRREKGRVTSAEAGDGGCGGREGGEEADQAGESERGRKFENKGSKRERAGFFSRSHEGTQQGERRRGGGCQIRLLCVVGGGRRVFFSPAKERGCVRREAARRD